MARRSYYQPRNKYRGRKVFLMAAFTVVLLLAIWRILFHVPGQSIENSDHKELILRSNTQTTSPVITTLDDADTAESSKLVSRNADVQTNRPSRANENTQPHHPIAARPGSSSTQNPESISGSLAVLKKYIRTGSTLPPL